MIANFSALITHHLSPPLVIDCEPSAFKHVRGTRGFRYLTPGDTSVERRSTKILRPRGLRRFGIQLQHAQRLSPKRFLQCWHPTGESSLRYLCRSSYSSKDFGRALRVKSLPTCYTAFPLSEHRQSSCPDIILTLPHFHHNHLVVRRSSIMGASQPERQFFSRRRFQLSSPSGSLQSRNCPSSIKRYEIEILTVLPWPPLSLTVMYVVPLNIRTTYIELLHHSFSPPVSSAQHWDIIVTPSLVSPLIPFLSQKHHTYRAFLPIHSDLL